MPRYVDPTHVDYRYGGDKLSNLSQKYMTTIEYVFNALNELGSTFFKVENGWLYLQDGNQWIKFLEAAPYGGLKNDTFGKLQSGTILDRPESANQYDTYWCTDGRVYQWLDGKWEIILSKNIEDLNGYENFVTQDDVTTTAAPGKIIRANAVGSLDANITGSPGKIANKTVFAPEPQDNQVLTYSASSQRWELKSRGEINESDVSTTGEPNKIVRADGLGRVHADITGNARLLANKEIDAILLKDGDALVFDGTSGAFTNKPVVLLVDGAVVEANITGSAAKWCGEVLDTNNIQDGQVLAWSDTKKAFVNTNQGGLGNARMLVLKQNGVDVAEYNGSERVEMNFPAIIVGDTPPEGADMWVKPTDGESKDYVVVNLPSIVVSTEYPTNAAVWIKPTDIGA